MLHILENAVNFIKKYGSEKIVIIYDTDSDGIAAAVIISRTIERLFGELPVALPNNHDIPYLTNLTKNLYEEVIKSKARVLITVDMPLHEDTNYVLNLAKKCRILIIDHHQALDLNPLSKNIFHINPYFWPFPIDPCDYPVSKLVYEICDAIVNVENLIWLAGVGIINEGAENVWRDFMEVIYEKYDIKKNGLKKLCKLINSGYYHSGEIGGKFAFEACLQASSPHDILETRVSAAKRLNEFHKKIAKEIERLVNIWRKEAEVIHELGLVFWKLPTKLLVQSPVATEIGYQEPEYTFVIAKDAGEITYLHFRNQSRKINCAELAAFSTRGLKNAGGGGHIPAAGGHIMTKDLDVVKGRIVRYLSKRCKSQRKI
jgi:single-stranded DNA-specific DHH superfamily exonuclease